LVEVNEIFSVADYQVYIQKTVEEMKANKKPIVVVGGSGFYLQSFLSPVVDDIEVSAEIREQVEDLYSREDLDGILFELKKLNPDGLGEMDTLNPRRVMRGLERCLASGKSILELKNEFEKNRIHFLSLRNKYFGWTGRMRTSRDEFLIAPRKCWNVVFSGKQRNY
jgi:tRNA dimethylallyltransferase